MKLLQTLTCLGIVLAATCSHAATTYTDGVGVPTIFHPLVVGDFDDGTVQGWGTARIDTIASVGGVLTNTDPGGLGSNDLADVYVFLPMGSANALPGVPASFVVGELPGQYDIVQFDVRFDVLPPEDPLNPGSGLIDSRIRGRHFLQGGATHGVTYVSNSEFPADNDFHTYTIQRDFNDAAWGVSMNRVRIDMIDGIPNSDWASILGAKFSIDNVILGRTTATEAFPAINPVLPNIVRNGDISDVSNLVLGGTITAGANINGSHGNYGPFRGNTVDVDHWAPYSNNPNMIVEAVNAPDGQGLNLTHSTNGNQGSFYLDTHWSTQGQFSLNSAGGYLNGMIQTDILNGVTIDDSATYELAFDINFNDRPSNPNSNFKVALTVGTNSTDPNTAVPGSLFDQQLSSINVDDRQVLSISGAALKAAQDSGNPVNLILQSLADTTINNFPGGTPVPNDHVDGNVFTQVQVDNLSLVRTFVIPTGDVNKDGVVTQADVSLAQLYLDGNGGETAAKRQDDLWNAPSAPFRSEILASLNLTDFDLDASEYFDAADVAAIAALVVTGPGDFDGDGDVDGADFLGWQRTDPSQIAVWESNFGAGSVAASSAIPEPTSWLMAGLLALTAVTAGGRNRS
jgi:hypothetical protein